MRDWRSQADWAKAHEAVKELIRFIGDDPEREDLQDTPKRFLLAWANEWGNGNKTDPPEVRVFNNPAELKHPPYDNEMVIQQGVQLYSHCEHHLCPFWGTADIGYIPDNAIIGLSKLARVVDHFSRQLQTQERLTSQIADYLSQTLSRDVAVRIRASHMCMITRGVSQPNTITTTSALRGNFLAKPTVRTEFLSLISK
jgi:GTP cyclohydrolase IA